MSVEFVMRLDVSWAGVVSLARYREARDQLSINTIIAYWDGLRRERLVPGRADIDPRGIETALDDAFILERLNSRSARFRIAGRRLDEVLGVEARGVPFAGLFAPAARDRAGEIVESVFRAPEIADLSLTSAEGGAGARLVLLPLTSDLGDVTRALGCLVPVAVRPVQAQKFVITDSRAIPLCAGRPVEWPGLEKRSPVPGFAEPAVPFHANAAASGPGKRPHLRLVPSGE